MNNVTKESFFEATFKTIEEFDNAEIAAKSDVSNNAELKITDIKLDKSVIKLKQRTDRDAEK
tara:strand:- start:162 stop:347 length:186 start_codon:yes stop_codon:yes gene_type:complete